jgi:hypothetical protein
MNAVFVTNNDHPGFAQTATTHVSHRTFCDRRYPRTRGSSGAFVPDSSSSAIAVKIINARDVIKMR